LERAEDVIIIFKGDRRDPESFRNDNIWVRENEKKE
jgi:hypothetical protein